MKRLHQILTVFLVASTFFVMQAFGYGTLQAQADQTVTSPEGIYYKAVPGEARNVNSTDKLRTIDNNNTGYTDNIRNDNNLLENAKKGLKETADNVRDSVSRNVNDTARNIGDNVTTPEGTYYKSTPDAGNYSNNDRYSQNSGNPLKDAADNVREKLNLDEPLPRSTKEFLNSTEKRVEKTVQPVTRTPEGYYQEPSRAR
ncbi:hypothetical protein WA1_17270 [Scytonema hofmannii PCC 7110]|uniref:Uncharacterized protein n=1 Tax=Scytonema hofmannii PCC 7110 TaxID=128403 RepID=A0A139XAR2_9CYAN|nr:hypothetical protein [Scytonema hofmannii]KYC41780.1 hypothetical protein WA1_17270 [Scytonema hofmannii PCC 7110]